MNTFTILCLCYFIMNIITFSRIHTDVFVIDSHIISLESQVRVIALHTIELTNEWVIAVHI